MFSGQSLVNTPTHERQCRCGSRDGIDETRRMQRCFPDKPHGMVEAMHGKGVYTSCILYPAFVRFSLPEKHLRHRMPTTNFFYSSSHIDKFKI